MLLVVRMQVLVEQSRLICTDPHILWDEWRGDVVVMNVPRSDTGVEVFVHGAHVTLMWSPYDTEWALQTFDFSRWGCSSLPLWADGGGGTERSVLFEGEGGLGFDVCGYVTPGGNLWSLSDGSLFYLVSHFPQSVGSEVTC